MLRVAEIYAGHGTQEPDCSRPGDQVSWPRPSVILVVHMIRGEEARMPIAYEFDQPSSPAHGKATP
jgi:hypothetical protein